MSKLLDLAQTIEQKTNERAKTSAQIAENAFKQHEKRLSDLLKQSESSIQNSIQSYQQGVQAKLDESNSNQHAVQILKNRWVWIALGALGALFIVLSMTNIVIAKKITENLAYRDNITQQIEQSPLQAQALAKVQIGKNDDGTLWIEPKNHKKAEVGKSTSGKPLMLLE